MLLNFITVFLASCALVNSALVIPKTQENKFADILMNSVGNFQSSPEQSMACISEFTPKMQALNDKNEASTIKCASDAEEGRKAVDTQNAATRSGLVSETGNMCSNFVDCNNDEDSITFFQCYSTNANEGSKTSTSVSRSANNAMQDTITSNQAVETQFIACSDKVSYEYKDEFDAAITAFNDCLKQ